MLGPLPKQTKPKKPKDPHNQFFSSDSQPWQHIGITAKSLQSCPTLCDPIDGNPPGSAVPRILQARTQEWAAISFSSARK